MKYTTKALARAAAAILLVAAIVLLSGCPLLNRKSFIPSFTTSGRMGDAPWSVTFTDTSAIGKAEREIVSYLWSFGDGAHSAEASPTHVYTAPGAYDVALTIVDDKGRTRTLTRPNFIIARDPNREAGEFAGEPRTFAGIEFVWVPAGTFLMGVTEQHIYWEVDAVPQHEVTISQGFWMSKYEITQDQWRNVMGADPSHFLGTFFGVPDAQLPVESVSWQDCQEFVRRMNQLGEGVFRLPFEAEWEYACRAGTETAYYFGDDAAELWYNGWYYDNGFLRTSPVGYLGANSFGLYDMHGNVWEWCQDVYDEFYYETSPSLDPLGPDGGPFHVARGGSWYHPAHLATSTSRIYYTANTRYPFLGLRLVRQ